MLDQITQTHVLNLHFLKVGEKVNQINDYLGRRKVIKSRDMIKLETRNRGKLT